MLNEFNHSCLCLNEERKLFNKMETNDSDFTNGLPDWLKDGISARTPAKCHIIYDDFVIFTILNRWALRTFYVKHNLSLTFLCLKLKSPSEYLLRWPNMRQGHVLFSFLFVHSICTPSDIYLFFTHNSNEDLAHAFVQFCNGTCMHIFLAEKCKKKMHFTSWRWRQCWNKKLSIHTYALSAL